MKDEVAREVECIKMTVQALHDFGTALKQKGDVRFAGVDQEVRAQASELAKHLDKTRTDTSELAERYEFENGETPEGA